MNARFNYFILFGFCLALFSSSTLANAIKDPLNRLGSLSSQPMNNVRMGSPYHFARVPPSITSVPAANQTLGGKFTTRLASPYFQRAFNVSSLVRYSQVAAAGALRGCIASGPACFGGAVLGVGVGLGIEYFLSSYGYSFDSSTGGFVEIEGTITSPVDSCIFWQTSSNVGTSPAVCGGYPLGTVWSSMLGAQPYQFTDIESAAEWYMQAKNNDFGGSIVLTRYSDCFNCGFPPYEVRGWQLSNNGRFYWLPISFFEADSNNGLYTIYFKTGSVQGGLDLSDVISVEEVGSSVDSSVVLESLDFSSYVPDTTDFSILANYLSETSPSYIEFDPIPDYYGEPSVSTVTNNGVVTETTTTPSYSFQVRNNASSSPEIVVRASTQVVVRVDGNVQSDTATEVEVLPPPATGVNPETGLPYPPTPPSADRAYDCWSFQFICEWFAWTREVPDVSIDQLNFDDLKSESEIEYIQRSVNVGVPASCPTGIDIDLGYFGDFTVSYDSFCDLAETSKPLYLAFISLLSLFIVYRAFSS